MSHPQVKMLMNEMKLIGMAQSVEKTAATATHDGWTYFEFIDVLLQAERESRDLKRKQNRIKASRIRRTASFEDFDLTAKRSLTKTQLKEIETLKWLDDGRPLLFIGPTGVGKTYLAEATGLHVCGRGKLVLFMPVTSFLEQLLLARSTNTHLKCKERIIKPDLLILDDFGLRKFTVVEAEDLRQVLEERSYGKSTLITTQLPLSHWSEVLPDPVLTEAIVDRLQGLAVEIKITGESYRRVKARKLDSPVEVK
jgi:DNA replication protein DnaC